METKALIYLKTFFFFSDFLPRYRCKWFIQFYIFGWSHVMCLIYDYCFLLFPSISFSLSFIHLLISFYFFFVQYVHFIKFITNNEKLLEFRWSLNLIFFFISSSSFSCLEYFCCCCFGARLWIFTRLKGYTLNIIIYLLNKMWNENIL